MRKFFRMLTLSASVVTLAAIAGMSASHAADEAKVSEEALAKGKEIAFSQQTGNCLACHMITGGELPGNIGPPLIAMKARFPDRAVLREQIYDARIKNPMTIMIPFGPHQVLSEEEIDLVTDYIHTL
ncbi:MAG: Sulfur oxidation protein SoxX [uncultured Thiotrichaceae bacterium]|uniref:Sulfur oxidation protein SoxX n=1 Tax=uncultured Thiotrichaceae bacterium TaxID=298394 RepID=A0A6S6U8Y7_9GAMM|nr:MAG: Sulfur oxidation protein SoxX [uncultured Thiotrichaceae bacterium]